MHKAQLVKAVLVTFGVIAAFFAGVPVAMAAFLGGALLLLVTYLINELVEKSTTCASHEIY